MRRAALVPIYLLALAVVAGLALALRAARAARAQPVDGAWSAEFRLDSMTPPWGDRAWRPAARRAAGPLALRSGPAPYPWLNGVPWRPTFVGGHAVDFAPLLGRNGTAAPEAVGVRFGPDSVHVFLSGECCHTGGVRGRGRIVGDSVVGRWTTDSDGWAAWGHFTLRRPPARSAPGPAT